MFVLAVIDGVSLALKSSSFSGHTFYHIEYL